MTMHARRSTTTEGLPGTGAKLNSPQPKSSRHWRPHVEREKRETNRGNGTSATRGHRSKSCCPPHPSWGVCCRHAGGWDRTHREIAAFLMTVGVLWACGAGFHGQLGLVDTVCRLVSWARRRCILNTRIDRKQASTTSKARCTRRSLVTAEALGQVVSLVAIRVQVNPCASGNLSSSLPRLRSCSNHEATS